MKISHLRTNHITNPLGFEFNQVSLSWITEKEDSASVSQSAAQVEISLDESFDNLLFDSGKSSKMNSLGYIPNIELKPRTRYHWRVTVWGDAGDQVTSESAWFETAKMDEPWEGQWIAPDLDKEIHPLIRKTFLLSKEVTSARVYISGVGLYDFEINGVRVGDEVLAPGYHAYDFWLQYQTYDVTDYLNTGDRDLLNHEIAKKHLKDMFPELIKNSIVLNQFMDSALRDLGDFPPMAKLVTPEKLAQFDQKA